MSPAARVSGMSTLVRICRIVAGLVMLAAALSKIGAPAVFAGQIENYDLVPVGFENLIAITLPWIEFLAGLALVLGVRARSGAWLALGMMVVFTLAVAQALARGLNIECGCFGTADASRIGLTKLLENLAFTAVSIVAAMRVE
jgi:uncharacterized membrane protein YphA (DoxX/SURF4 family)